MAVIHEPLAAFNENIVMLTTHPLITAASLIALVSVTPVNAQLATIPEQLARAGHSLSSGASVPSGLAPSVDDILAETDLIVRGIVQQPRSYLSDDQMEVFTDYSILNPTIFYQSEKAASVALNMPGIVVTLIGGTVAIDGLRFTSTPQALPRLDAGSDCLLLLKAHRGRYHLAGDYFGAFRIMSGRIMPLVNKQGFASDYANADIGEARKELVQRVRTLHRQPLPQSDSR